MLSIWNEGRNRYRSSHRGRWSAMTPNKLNPIEMTRRSRGSLHQPIKDNTLSEPPAFYRETARAFNRQLGLREPGTLPIEPDTVHTPAVNDEDHQHREP